MPELPEIESLRRKMAPKILGARVERIVLRRSDLRYPITGGVATVFNGRRVTAVRRRSKYLLLDFEHNHSLIVHLGMSGQFFFSEPSAALDRHDHVLIDIEGGRQLRLRDPRRFGMMFACPTTEVPQNRFFRDLGVEPLEEVFDAELLLMATRKSKAPIKSLLMNANIVVGVGNIYASEALYRSGVRPTRSAARLTRAEAASLVVHIKAVLADSIQAGGTSFRDYVDADQKPGYHQVNLAVYGRAGKPCLTCKTLIRRVIQTGRSSFFCPHCQK